MQTRELVWEAQLRGIDPDAVKQMMTDDTPLGRLEAAEDVAKVVRSRLRMTRPSLR
jgi:hypothetical protein